MINQRKLLYGRETVGGTRELDYLKTHLVSSNLLVRKEVTITDDVEFRPDLISKKELGSYHYGWLIMDFNDILDPYSEMYAGRKLKIPDMTNYFEFFSEASKISKDDRRN